MLAACDTSLPSLEGRVVSTALEDTDATRLGQAIVPRVAAHPDLSGIHALADARDAFAARILLANAAEKSLDVAYYIWRGDTSGARLFEALRAAADRDVRVRLLLDDNNTAGLDPALAALDAHPRVEVRLFNPFPVRGLRAIGYVTDFRRVNRRMHNKSFTADNQATIVGGRNVGDEYFAATGGTLFSDLDVLAVGPVVKACRETSIATGRADLRIRPPACFRRPRRETSRRSPAQAPPPGATPPPWDTCKRCAARRSSET